MSEYILHIKNSEQKLRKLDAIIKSKSYMGCGIGLSLRIGANEDAENLDMSFGIATDTEALMKHLRDCQADVLSFWERAAKQELKELSEFLSTGRTGGV